MALKKFHKQIILKLKTALLEARDCFVFYKELARRTVESNHYPFSRIQLDIKQWPEPSGNILHILRTNKYIKNNNLSQEGEVINDALKRYVVQLLIPSCQQYSTIDYTVKSGGVLTISAGETREVVDIIAGDHVGDHPSVFTIRAETGARVMYVFAVFGNGEITKDVTLELEEGAEGRIVGVVVGSGKGHFKLKTTLHHKGARTKGDIKVKMVLKDAAQVVYDGMIKIAKTANQTNSYLYGKALALNRGVRCDAQPELEIEANDVKASHAFSQGQIDAEQLFYLRSRGLSEEEAKQMIVEGFLMDVAERLSYETKERIKQEIALAL